MIGVWANVCAIAVGTLVGLLFRHSLTQKILDRCQLIMGICLILMGLKMALKFNSATILILSLVVGGVIGTSLRIEQRAEEWLASIQSKLNGHEAPAFAQGLIATSMMFCMGAMAIVGPINAAVLGDHEVLFAKASIDGILSITMAAVYGPSVLFSALPVMLYQGGILLLTKQFGLLSHPQVLSEVSGVGGVLLLMIGMNLANFKKIAVSDFLPSLILAATAASIWAN